MTTVLSIVIPVYNNEANLPESLLRINDVKQRFEELDVEIELIFVVDGSPDKSYDYLVSIRDNLGKHKIINFTRNFGAITAVMCGLEHATGDCISAIAADMQDPPELLVDMYSSWKNGSKFVIATRESRDDPALSKLFSMTFYKLYRLMVLPSYPKKGFDLFLIDQTVNKELLHNQEKNMHIQTALLMLGYDYVSISYHRAKREIGKSSWTFSKRFKLFVDSFVSYSYTPIRFMSFAGFIIAAASVIYGAYVVIMTLIYGREQPGFAAIIAVITFLQGFILIMMGITGEYIWRILDEVRNRKPYVIESKHESED